MKATHVPLALHLAIPAVTLAIGLGAFWLLKLEQAQQAAPDPSALPAQPVGVR